MLLMLLLMLKMVLLVLQLLRLLLLIAGGLLLRQLDFCALLSSRLYRSNSGESGSRSGKLALRRNLYFVTSKWPLRRPRLWRLRWRL